VKLLSSPGRGKLSPEKLPTSSILNQERLPAIPNAVKGGNPAALLSGRSLSGYVHSRFAPLAAPAQDDMEDASKSPDLWQNIRENGENDS